MASHDSALSLREATHQWWSAPVALRFGQREPLRGLAEGFDRLHQRIEELVNTLTELDNRVDSFLRSGRPFEHQAEFARNRARAGESDLVQSLTRLGMASELVDDRGFTDELWRATYLIRGRISARAGQPDRDVGRDLALLREVSLEFAGARDNLIAAVATFGGGTGAGRPRRGIRMRASSAPGRCS